MRNAILRATTLASAVAACLPYAASAQLEEILVTATRRETNLQKTPLTVAAIGGDDLLKQNVTDPQNLGDAVPGLRVSSRRWRRDTPGNRHRPHP